MLKKIILGLIIILSFILRFYQLGENPPSLNWDENSNLYNAYSILKTGRDEYGNFLPLYNRSFDDYKPPLYMYLNVATVSVFGMTPFAARLPSAVFGLLTVPLMYLLSKEIFSHIKNSQKTRIALLATFIFSVTPWHTHFSRVGFEATVGFFLTLLGLTLLLKCLRNNYLLVVSSIPLALSMHAYHAQRIFIPLVLVLITFIFRKEISIIPKKYLLTFSLILFGAFMFIFILLPKEAVLHRLQSSSEKLQAQIIEKVSRFKTQDTSPLNLIHSNLIVTSREYFSNYISNFDINFLFNTGDDNFRHHTEGMGMLYLFILPLLVIGIYNLAPKLNNKYIQVVFGTFLLSALPAAPVTPSPHAIRSFLLLVPISIISAYGLFIFLDKFKNNYLYYISISSLFLWVIISIFTYFEDYFVHYPKNHAADWQYGYMFAARETEKLKGEYRMVNVDRNIEQAYIFWLVAAEYDPKLYFEKGTPAGFDKYNFGKEADYDSQVLFVSAPPKNDEIAPSFPRSFKVLKKIYYPDGKEALWIGRAKKDLEQ